MVRAWRLDLQDLRASGCETVGRNLTPTEWATLKGIDTPYVANVTACRPPEFSFSRPGHARPYPATRASPWRRASAVPSR
jgi:hypothetical protein